MSLEQLTISLTTAFSTGDFAKCATLLTPIKKELIKHQLLVPAASTNPSDKQITQSILEIGALTSLNLKQMNQFEHYITQLKVFYEDSQNPQSDNKNKLIGLYLLYILTKGDLSAFHIELEKFDDIVSLEQDQYLSIPIKFEQWIIDGDFYKINEYITNGSKFPSKEFQLFELDLLNTIRVQIAQNLETSYTSLKLENLKLLLFLKEVEETNKFIENFGWEIKNGSVYFSQKPEDDEVEENDDKFILKNALTYAREMESII